MRKRQVSSPVQSKYFDREQTQIDQDTENATQNALLHANSISVSADESEITEMRVATDAAELCTMHAEGRPSIASSIPTKRLISA